MLEWVCCMHLCTCVDLGADVCACSGPCGGQRSRRASCSNILCFIPRRRPGLAWPPASPKRPLPLPATAQYSHTRLLRASSRPHRVVRSVASFLPPSGSIVLPRQGIRKEQQCDRLSMLRPVRFPARDKSVWRLAKSQVRKCQPVPQ